MGKKIRLTVVFCYFLRYPLNFVLKIAVSTGICATGLGILVLFLASFLPVEAVEKESPSISSNAQSDNDIQLLTNEEQKAHKYTSTTRARCVGKHYATKHHSPPHLHSKYRVSNICFLFTLYTVF
jgi:hypothetical protein